MFVRRIVVAGIILIPTGLNHSDQGCEERATLGMTSQNHQL